MGQVESANSYSLNYLHIKVFISCIYKKLVSVSCENILQKCIGLACQEGLKEFTLTALFFLLLLINFEKSIKFIWNWGYIDLLRDPLFELTH